MFVGNDMKYESCNPTTHITYVSSNLEFGTRANQWIESKWINWKKKLDGQKAIYRINDPWDIIIV